MPPKLKREVKEFLRKSAKRLTFSGLKKIAVVLLLVGMNWSGLAAIGQTAGYFNDAENSAENSLSAATLDFSVTNQNIGGFIGVELGEDKEFISVVTKTSGSLDIQYKARAEKISGNDNFCNALKLEAFHSEISYDGTLLSFNTATTSSLGTWAFEVRLPHTASNFAHGEKCDVDLVFEGWRKDVADSSQSGFTDEERIQLRLISRMIVLNEFLPNPEGVEYGFDFGDDYSDMPQGEWVELYNNSDFSFDLAGWYIRDESATNKIMITAANTYPAGTIINGKKWLVVYMNKPVLNNTGDTVKLFDNTNILVDSYAYTSNDYCDIEPTPGEENTTETSGSCAGVPPNKSYARIPDGIGYWVDPIPTPGKPNLLSGEEIALGEDFILDAVSEIAGVFEEVLGLDQTNQTASGSQEITGEEEIMTASGSFEIVASPSEGQDEIADPAPVASESVEPSTTPEPPLDSPAGDPEGEQAPNGAGLTGQAADDQQPSAGDDSSIQAPIESAIPVEPVTVELPTEPVLPPADPPVPPAKAPAPAPEAPAAPAE